MQQTTRWAGAAALALLALLTARLTSHSQRWAWVPAAVMAATGLTLVVTQPGDGALDAAGWVWPPIMVALAVWMSRRIRHGFDGRVRWLLYPVVVSLAIVSAGAMFETATREHDDRTAAAPGTLRNSTRRAGASWAAVSARAGRPRAIASAARRQSRRCRMKIPGWVREGPGGPSRLGQ